MCEKYCVEETHIVAGPVDIYIYIYVCVYFTQNIKNEVFFIERGQGKGSVISIYL